MADFEARIVISARDRTGRALKSVRGSLDRLKKSIFSVKGAFAGLATAFSAKAIVDATIAQENALRQLEARLKSTGGVVGLTAEQITAFARDLQQVTTFGDEATIAMQNLLLTFTNIRGDVFREATVSILDMSIAMGQDLKSSAIQIGKALNDPVKGLLALSRVGVQFTDRQKAVVASLVETGKVAEAQRIILAELQTEFGGAATAAADSFGGSIARLKNAFGDLLEGDGLSGARTAIDNLTNALSNPAVGSAVSTLIELFATFGRAIVDLIAIIPELISTTVRLGDAQVSVGEVIQGAWNVITGTISAAVDRVIDALSGMAESSGDSAQSVATVWSNAAQGLINLFKLFANSVIGTFLALGKSIGVVVAGIVDSVRVGFNNIVRLAEGLGRSLTAAASGDFGFTDLGNAITESFDASVGVAERTISGIKDAINESISRDFVGEGLAALGDAAGSVVSNIRDSVLREIRAIRRENAGAGTPGTAIAANAPVNLSGAVGAGAAGRSGADSRAAVRAAREAAREAEQALREELAVKRQLLQDDLAFEQAVLQQREEALQNQLDDGLIGYRDFFTQLGDLRRQSVDLEISNNQELLTLTSDRIEQLRLLGSIRLLEFERSTVAIGLARQQAQAETDLGEKMLAVRLQVAELTGNLAEQTTLRLEQMRNQYAELIRQLLAMGDTAGVALVQKLINLRAMQEQTQRQAEGFQSFFEGAAGNVQNAFQQFLFDPFNANLRGILASYHRYPAPHGIGSCSRADRQADLRRHNHRRHNRICFGTARKPVQRRRRRRRRNQGARHINIRFHPGPALQRRVRCPRRRRAGRRHRHAARHQQHDPAAADRRLCRRRAGRKAR
jgi:Prophage tail length tape measure protein